MPGISLNIDNTFFFTSYKASEVNESIINAFVDHYKNTQVDRLIFSVNGMRASFPSRSIEPFWQGWDPEGGLDQPYLSSIPKDTDQVGRAVMDDLQRTLWQLEKMGLDPYAMWMDQCRKNGISPWITTRMNDIHNVNVEDHPFHCNLWRDDPQSWRIRHRFEGWGDRAMDFGYSPVRERQYALIEELFERYDFDGLELDWMRSAYHFRPGHEEEGTRVLTQFMRDVRALSKVWEGKRGHAIKLSVRVPSRPATSLYLGMDAAIWAREDLVDSIVVTPYWASTETDMPIEIWKQLLHGTSTRLEAGVEILLRNYRESKDFTFHSLETARGTAMSLLHRGADNIYLFNHFDQSQWGGEQGHRDMLCEVGNIETIRNKPRRHVVTFADTWGVGEPAAYPLPAVLATGSSKEFRLPIGEAPGPEEKAWIVLCVGDAAEDALADLTVRLNSQTCSMDNEFHVGKPVPTGRMVAFAVPPDAIHQGTNVVEIHGQGIWVSWVELAINS